MYQKPENLAVVKYLKNHSVVELSQEFPIRVTKHPAYNWYNFDYTSMAYDADIKKHPIVKECRGLLLDMDTLTPVARGFDRFFNLGELDTSFDTSQRFYVYPKLDGTYIMLFYADNKWHLKTRGSTTALGTVKDSNDVTFHDLFMSYAKQQNWDFDTLPTYYTYLFELTTPFNPIVVRYPDTKATLIGIRSTQYGFLLNIDHFRCKLVQYFGDDNVLKSLMYTSNLREVTEYVASLNGLENEGVVLVDDYNTLLKIKNKDWTAFHKKVWGITAIKAIELLINNDPDLDEITVYFPDIANTIISTRKHLTDTYEYIYNDYLELKKLSTRKEFAQAVFSDIKRKSYSPVYFGLYDNYPLEQLLTMIGKVYLNELKEA